MRIIVMSDSHGAFYSVKQIFEDNPGADLFIHLGDGARDFEEAGWVFPQTSRKAVRGNCDYAYDLELPLDGLLELDGKRMEQEGFYCYREGFRLGVNLMLEVLTSATV